MEIKFNVSDEIISDLLCTALEGGSNYWYLLGDVDTTHFVKDDTYVDNLMRSFTIDKDYKLDVYDLESDEDEPDLLGSVTYLKMGIALSIMAKDYPKTLGNIMSGNMDGDDADVWFQIATMGEVVFG
jgi:hypothetical protein